MLNTGLRNTSLVLAVLCLGASGALGAPGALVGCSSDADTVIALNVKLEKIPAGLSKLAVSITQAGQAPVTHDVEPPTVVVDGGTTIKDAFYERIILPDSWTDGPASVRVEAKSAAGATLATAEAEASVREQGGVAVYVTFPADPPADAGVDDAGG